MTEEQAPYGALGQAAAAYKQPGQGESQDSMTLGQRLVRPKYTELTDEQKKEVENFKNAAALLIDEAEKLRAKIGHIPGSGDIHDWINRAQRHFEDGCMLIVKAATAERRPTPEAQQG